MFYDRELSFLREVFSKAHLRAEVVPISTLESALSEYSIGGLIDPRFIDGGSVLGLLDRAERRTVYKITDSFERCFIFLLLDIAEAPSLLSIGPFLSSEIREERLLMISEEMKISVQRLRYLSEYYLSLPILQPDGHLMIMLTTFLEWLWKSPSFAIVEIGKENIPLEPIGMTDIERSMSNEVLVNAEAIEVRYAFENEMLRAVTLGKLHVENRLVSAFSPEMFEKRASNPLRNAKNYCIIMNTLLRKAAEEGGVHPFYLDMISSEFATRIEDLTAINETTELMREMFRRYCRLVRDTSTKSYSTNVRRAIVMIDADLSQDLSAGAIARVLGLSTPYLSTIFKREVKKTITEYILEKRMKLAERLLKKTKLQIQTVAQYCGILDLQYFSKLFRKKHGTTPSEYRERNK